MKGQSPFTMEMEEFVDVQCPPGVHANDIIHIQTQRGQLVQVTVPPGFSPGTVFRVAVPAAGRNFPSAPSSPPAYAQPQSPQAYSYPQPQPQLPQSYAYPQPQTLSPQHAQTYAAAAAAAPPGLVNITYVPAGCCGTRREAISVYIDGERVGSIMQGASGSWHVSSNQSHQVAVKRGGPSGFFSRIFGPGDDIGSHAIILGPAQTQHFQMRWQSRGCLSSKVIPSFSPL
jgi:hypothetical protein